MGRKLEFDKNKALEKAMNVFWGSGYEATSLEDLLSAMDISKGSFYHCFESKEALFKQCLCHYRSAVSKDLLKALQSASSGRKFIEELFDDAVLCPETKGKQMGCFVMNSAREFAHKDALIAQLVHESMQHVEQIFHMALERAQNEGGIPTDANSETLAQYLLSSLNGLKLMAQAGTSQNTLENIARTTLLSLN